MSKNSNTNAFASLAYNDQKSRQQGAGYGTDPQTTTDKKKPGRKPTPRHRTSFSFPIEDWELIERLADHYGGRISITDTIIRAVRDVAEREGITD